MENVLKKEWDIDDLNIVWCTLRDETERRIEGIENAEDVQEFRSVLDQFAEALGVSVFPFKISSLSVESEVEVAVGDDIEVLVTELKPARVLAINDDSIVVEIDGKKRVAYWNGDTWEARD